MNDETTLDAIGLRQGTDKSTLIHDYLPEYAKRLDHLRHERVCVMEIGWWEGNSMRMWREYFDHPDSTVVGVDIDAGQVLRFPAEGVIFEHADQTDRRQMHQIGERYGPFDLIVDDASHLSPHTGNTLLKMWQFVKPGGLYVIEDLQVSYHRAYGGDPNPNKRLNHSTTSQTLRRVVDDVHWQHAAAGPAETYLGNDVASVHFHPGICFIQKAVS